MEGILSKNNSKEIVKSSVFDILALSVVYLVPVFSHMFTFPLYYFEPMRIMLLLSILYTSKRNSFIIAATMPIFSFAVSAHPVLFKSFLMMAELSINVWLFYFFAEKFKNKFTAVFVSVGLSKIIYYLAKFGLLSLALLTGDLIATPILIQIAMILVFSGYFFLVGDRK